MRTRDYLTVADVVAMHVVLIRRHGGKPGLRDLGALDATADQREPSPGHRAPRLPSGRSRLFGGSAKA